MQDKSKMGNACHNFSKGKEVKNLIKEGFSEQFLESGKVFFEENRNNIINFYRQNGGNFSEVINVCKLLVINNYSSISNANSTNNKTGNSTKKH